MSAQTQIQRLDIAVVAAGLTGSRSRARDLIRRGFVAVDGQVVIKPAASVRRGAVITLSDMAPDFVSRGAEKLVAALEAYSFDPKGRVVIDIGASTGGFSQVLLRGGASQVYAVDVGHGQLHPRIAADQRVISLEGMDARGLDRSVVLEGVQAIVADVSFISLTKVLGPAMQLAEPGAWLVGLIKPQFEVGPGVVGKGGIVADDAARQHAIEIVRQWFDGHAGFRDGFGWQLTQVISSPVAGGDGNQEYLIGATLRG